MRNETVAMLFLKFTKFHEMIIPLFLVKASESALFSFANVGTCISFIILDCGGCSNIFIFTPCRSGIGFLIFLFMLFGKSESLLEGSVRRNSLVRQGKIRTRNTSHHHAALVAIAFFGGTIIVKRAWNIIIRNKTICHEVTHGMFIGVTVTIDLVRLNDIRKNCTIFIQNIIRFKWVRGDVLEERFFEHTSIVRIFQFWQRAQGVAIVT
mmetsp:Transcript_16763/g.31760  ORF Transcript_16763/g.31760 Transcript_16763/m.31760 type:complete len:209 (-) Transcript_16763:1052-1678(-)